MNALVPGVLIPNLDYASFSRAKHLLQRLLDIVMTLCDWFECVLRLVAPDVEYINFHLTTFIRIVRILFYFFLVFNISLVVSSQTCIYYHLSPSLTRDKSV